MPKRILFIYNQVTVEERRASFSECALVKDVEIIREALKESNNHILSLDLHSPLQLEEFILANQPIDLAFVIAEGFKGNPHTLYNGHGAALVRKYLTKHNIPCTHSSFESMEICRNKDLTYARLRERGIPIPQYLVFETHFIKNIRCIGEQVSEIGYPVIIKPAGGGNSIGISSKSVVYNLTDLEEQVKAVQKQLGHTTLIIEKYLAGQEYTIGILGNKEKYVLPVIGFPKDLGVRDAGTKITEHTLRDKFEFITESDERFNNLLSLGVDTFEAVLANDVLRIDLKEDELGDVYVIDVNGTPALSLTGSLNFMASGAGLKQNQLIQLVLYESMLRYGLAPNIFFEELVKGLILKLIKHESIEVA
ncbi:MAG: hypothetical protein JM58_10895 [Peptococcaceae bacterium BICA1-8]|nr:MAG: hypothetical protein JM58_10895 [Peptococcaceae bacterium BICA1-8]